MRLEIDVPDIWAEKGKKWDSTQLMKCNQCPFRSPDMAMYVSHVYTEHGTKDESLILDN